MLVAFLPWFSFQEAKSQESKEAPKPSSEDENDTETVQEADDGRTAIDLRLIITIRLLAQPTFLPSSQPRQILGHLRSSKISSAGSARMLQEQLKVSLQPPLFWSSQAS